MISNCRRLIVALTVLGAAGPVLADNNFGLGAKVGTLGAGIEGSWRPIPFVDLRVGGNFFDFDNSGTYAGVGYDGTLNLESYYGTVNLKFPLSPLRVTAGAYANGNELYLASDGSPTLVIGGSEYSAADVGTLSSTTSFEGTAPYFGLGLDFTILRKVGLNFDLGVLWQGEPQVAMAADGPIANEAVFMQSLENERRELQEEMKDFKAWPVVSLGFVFNF